MDALEALVSIALIVAGIVISQKKKKQKVQKSVYQHHRISVKAIQLT